MKHKKEPPEGGSFFYSFTCFMDRLMRCFFSSTSSTTTLTISPTATT